MQKLFFLSTLVLGLGLSAFAQKNELAFVAGAKITPTVGTVAAGNQTSFSTGFGFEASYAAQLAHVPAVALHLELPFVGAPTTNITSTNLLAVKSYNSFFFTPALRLKLLPGSPVSPWISGGYGLAHFSPGNTTLSGSTTTTSSTNTGAAEAGAGLDFHPPLMPLALRMEVRDFYSGKPNLNAAINPRNHFMVGGGVVFRF
jgi:Outer membrane protein beta-barrel domain